ncbi:MAG TPA: glycoside hydrolase family 2 protein [Candidatus Sulfotelmatobacter sp.]|nr:glycoside hydrolase family 2 protein [Candidatus Sulfotelmatobacter sp.]
MAPLFWPAVLLCCIGPAGPAQAMPAGKQVVCLDKGWEFRQRGAPPGACAADWLPAQVPGDVHLDLLRHRLIPDPFYRDNEAKLQWVTQADWEYGATVAATPELLRHRNVELVFDGLDAYCEVYLNGRLVLTADNMFRAWRVDAKPWLKAGANRILVLFPSPTGAADRAAATDPWRGRTGVEARTYVRKAAYEYGWDWAPTFVTSGIWRPVRIEAWDEARISDLHIRQRDVAASVAHLTVEVEVTASVDAAAEVALRYQDAGRPAQVLRKVGLHAGVNHVDVPVEIDRPRLWYPAGYGGQPLYAFEAGLRIGAQTVDVSKDRTGLRSVELRRELDPWGRSFEFVINGIEVFAKGADVVPFDSFPNRVTTASYRRILESAKAANMNIIRHWGGGYYETDEFYSLCDELGLMVWQDFMFGNEMQPGTYPFKLSVAQEAADQIRRLRNHPSLVLWCGNNETEDAFRWPGRVPADPAAGLQMWKDYLTISSGILGRAVERLAPETPYWPSSPSSDYEAKSAGFETGDMHSWSVWIGRAPIASYEDDRFRFVSEYGFQSFPSMRTVESFTTAEDRTGILTPVMRAHQKDSDGNAVIREYMLKDYPEPRDFASFLYVSQVLQAEAIKLEAEHLRRDRPRCMGSIFWQLNDCWPVASWSSIDYGGRWKALQYYARRFYAPLLVSPHQEDGGLAVYAVSDMTQPVAARLRVRLMAFDGTILHDRTIAVQIDALSSHVCSRTGLDQLLPGGKDPARAVVVTDLSVGGRVVSRNLVYLRPTREIRLPAAHISAEVLAEGAACGVRLTCDALARSVCLSLGALDAEPSDNYFDLLPGEPVDIRIKGMVSVDDVRRNLSVRSLADAFGPDPRDPVDASRGQR